MRVVKNPTRKFIPKRGKRLNFTTMRGGTKTERGIVRKCRTCGEKGAVRANRVMRCNFITHHALIRPDGEFKITSFCLE